MWQSCVAEGGWQWMCGRGCVKGRRGVVKVLEGF